MLQEKRNELLDELDAVDKAIAALKGTPVVEAHQPEPRKSILGETTVIPIIVKAKRVLAEAHKQAMIAGRRKARQAKDVAAGVAREMPDETFVPSIATGNGGEAPRLVKRNRELGR
jgi:hypothetical protein